MSSTLTGEMVLYNMSCQGRIFYTGQTSASSLPVSHLLLLFYLEQCNILIEGILA